MKQRAAHMFALMLAAGTAQALLAATPAQERAFVDAYRRAYEGRDHPGRVALLYTKGADPQALVFYKMVLGAEMGGRMASIELVEPSAEDRAHAQTARSPSGRPQQLVLPATKKLVITSTAKGRDGSASSTSEVFVGESDGRLWILVPGAAK